MYDKDDIVNAALCSWKEAREDGSTGMHAVLHCLKNRVGFPGFADTLHGVIYGKNQFSSMSIPSDPEFNLEPVESNKDDWIMWLAALQLANVVLNTDDADPTKHPETGQHAHYYENPKTGNSGWFNRVIVADNVNHPFTVQICHHKFYV